MIQIEENEWWFNGHIIQKQNDFRLPNWISFPDTDDQLPTIVHGSKKEAVKFAIDNPITNPKNIARDYL